MVSGGGSIGLNVMQSYDFVCTLLKYTKKHRGDCTRGSLRSRAFNYQPSAEREVGN